MWSKSFMFLVGQGSTELMVAEKRKAFTGVGLLGSRCIVWLLSMVEEVLQNPGFEDSVHFREGSKVTIVQRGENRSGCFLEVAVDAMSGRRGLFLFSKGRDGQGWSRVSGKLSKVLAFLEDDGKMGKAAGSMPFMEMLRMAAPVSVKGYKKKCVGAYGVSEMETRQVVAGLGSFGGEFSDGSGLLHGGLAVGGLFCFREAIVLSPR